MNFSSKTRKCSLAAPFLRAGAAGLGSVALASLLNPRLLLGGPSTAPALMGAVNPLHFAPKAKRVIYLYMAGGPSHLETFDYKPKLAQMSGQPMPDSFTKGQPIAQLQGNSQLKCLEPQWKFNRYGKSGQEISELFPRIGSVADDICIVRSMVTDAINHDPAHTFMNTGTTISGRPAMGSWLWYGLGSECENLPGFVVLTSTGKSGQQQPIASRQWHSGFLPSKFQGVHLHSKGDPVLYINSPAGVTRGRQKDVIDTVEQLNCLENNVVDDPEIATRISQYEMAFKMQTSVPGLIDVADEPAAVLESYGAKTGDGSFASNCLLARRLAERGVRFIQCYHRDWDHHGNLKDGFENHRRRGGQTHGRPHRRSQAARDAGRHAGDLGRRVWPNADGAGERPGSPHQRIFNVLRRRRHQAGHHARRYR